MARPFCDDERVAGEHDRHVVMPAGVPAAFIVIEAKFALEVLIGALGAPTLHHDAHELLPRHLVDGERAEEVVRRLGLTVAPLDQEPDRCSSIHGMVVLARLTGPHDAPDGETSRQVTLRTLPPRASPESAIGFDSQRELLHAD